MKTTQIIFIIALLALAAGIGVRMFNQWQIEQQPMRLPTFSFPDLNGKQQISTQWQGKIIVLNFWATWCPACLKEIPAFIALQAELGEKCNLSALLWMIWKWSKPSNKKYSELSNTDFW